MLLEIGVFILNWLHQAIKPMDLLIAVFAVYLFAFEIDYDNMSWADEVYVACFAVWFVLLAIRCYIYMTGRSGKSGGRKRE